MSKIIPELVSIEELLKIHSSISTEFDEKLLNFGFTKKKPNSDFKNLKDRNSIYILLKNNYPVYLGRSVDASSRTRNHLKDKLFDDIYIFHAEPHFNDLKVLQYIEFLCYYALWSRGYCTIYNSQDVWNSLPLKSQKGPRLNSNAIGYAHLFVKNFLNSLSLLNLNNPEKPGDVLQLRYSGNQSIKMNAAYWRPSIKKELHQEAIRYWDLKLQERISKSKSPEKVRCSFAGAGSFMLINKSMGNIMFNDYDQQFTYDILKDMGLFEERSGDTTWLKSHPFPKSNLMLHILQGKNSPNARNEIIVEHSNKTIDLIENNWQKHRILHLPD